MRDEQGLGPCVSLRNRAVDRYLFLPCLINSGGFERKYFAEIDNQTARRVSVHLFELTSQLLSTRLRLNISFLIIYLADSRQ